MKMFRRMVSHARAVEPRRRLLLFCTLSMLLASCASDQTTTPKPTLLTAENGYWQIALNHQAFTLSTVAPYDTIRIIATPRNATGTPLTGSVLDSAVTTYALSDPSDTSVTITPDGVVRARFPQAAGLLIVQTSVQGITRSISIPFTVT